MSIVTLKARGEGGGEEERQQIGRSAAPICSCRDHQGGDEITSRPHPKLPVANHDDALA